MVWLTKVGKWHMQNRVGIKINQFDLIIMKETTEETIGRHAKPMHQMVSKDNDLVNVKHRVGFLT